MSRAAGVSMVVATLLIAGCGDPDDSTVPTPAHAPCTKSALLRALRAEAPGSSASLRALRCAAGYALTRVSQGETRATLLWKADAAGWAQIERVAPGVCSARAAAHGLCAQPAPDPALRRCGARAFVAALRENVDRLRFVIDRMRCRGDFAITRYTISDCLPEQTERGDACERTRVAAWRRDATRWRLITYAPNLDCAAVREAAPRFPGALCRRPLQAREAGRSSGPVIAGGHR